MNFQITIPGEVSDQFIDQGVYNFEMAIEFVRALEYGRTSNNPDYTLVLKEKKGTCSSKHALLAALAREQNQTDIKLVIAIYWMTEANTKGIGSHLSENGLTYLPEAHCYLKVGRKVVDVSFSDSDFNIIGTEIHAEELIEPEQIGSYKINFHKRYLENWIKGEKLSKSLEQVWEIREKCIKNLSP